jgi:hypothetical protein
MDKGDIRRANLRAWIAKHHKGLASEFCRKWELNQSHISEMLAGKRPLGERVARQMEQKARMPPEYLDGISGGTKEASSPYHGILLTRAGASLGAEWEKLDIDRRAHYEALIYGEVAKKARNSRRAPLRRGVEDEEK